MFSEHQYFQIVISDLGVILWLLAIGAGIQKFGFSDVFRVYLAPYLW